MYNLTKEESERIKIVKFIAIILVVYFHSYNPPFCERYQCVMKHWLTFAFLFYLPSDTILL